MSAAASPAIILVATYPVDFLPSLVSEDMLKPTTDGGRLNAKHLRRDKFKDRTYPIMCTAYISSKLIRSRKGLEIV